MGCVDAGVVNVLREGGVDYNGRGGGACVGAGNRSRASKVRFTRAVPRAADRWAAGREDNTMAVMELIVRGCILHVPARGFYLYLPITDYTIYFTLLP